MHVFARFCKFLHVFAHYMYLRYTCYKVLTFNSTDLLFLNITYHWPYNTQFWAARAFQFPKKRASRPYCNKFSIFLTTYPPLNADIICEGYHTFLISGGSYCSFSLLHFSSYYPYYSRKSVSCHTVNFYYS